jgi:hypothetical protein
MISWFQHLSFSQSCVVLIIVAFALYFLVHLWRVVSRSGRRRRRRMFISNDAIRAGRGAPIFHVPSAMADRKGITK